MSPCPERGWVGVPPPALAELGDGNFCNDLLAGAKSGAALWGSLDRMVVLEPGPTTVDTGWTRSLMLGL